jgi:hypothetical protein
MEKGLNSRESQGLGGLNLPPWNRFQARADNLSVIGSYIENESSQPRDIRRKFYPETRKSKKDDEDLNEKRCVPKNLHIDCSGQVENF